MTVMTQDRFRHRFILYLAMLGMCLSIMAGAVTLIKGHYKQKSIGLPAQIKEVEGALKNLQGLETYLENTKSDMEATEQAKAKIEEEYKKAQELKPITKQQYETIGLIINRKTTMDILKAHALGFVLGVSTSVIGCFIHGFIKRKKKVIIVQEAK